MMLQMKNLLQILLQMMLQMKNLTTAEEITEFLTTGVLTTAEFLTTDEEINENLTNVLTKRIIDN